MKVFRSLLPFLVISALCAGGVELFYRYALYSLFRPILTAKETDASSQRLGEGKIEKKHNYQLIIDRNLFGTGPIGPDSGGGIHNPLAGLSITSLDVVLLGTIVGENDDKRAIIMDKEQKMQEIYHIGDSVQGAIIKDILRGKVVLGFRGRDEILDMAEARQYFAETVTIPPSQGLQKALPAPEEIQPVRPVDTGIKILPRLRKFSVQNGTK